MKIKVTHKIGLLDKFVSILFGTFLTTSIFAITTKLLGIWGIWLGLIICGAIVMAHFKYGKKGSHLHLVVWGMVATIAICLVGYIVTIGFLESAL